MIETYRINPRHEMTLYNLVALEFNAKNYKKSLVWLREIPDFDLKYQKTFEKIIEKLQSNSGY